MSAGIPLDDADRQPWLESHLFAALGRPVLDGLGVVGGGAHVRHEDVLLDRVPARTARLAGLLTAYAQ